MIRDLWNGNVRLVIAYWVFGVMVSFAYNILYQIIIANISTITIGPLGHTLIYAFAAFPFFYFPFIFVAIWRSANKYTKSKWWSSLAQIAVFAGSLSLLYNGIDLAQGLFSENSLSSGEINEQIVIINKNLPKMLDNETELTNVTFENNVISFNYRIIESDNFRIDKNKFIDLDKSIITNFCKEPLLKSILAGGGSVAYIYKDNQGNVVNRAVVNGASCQH
jgi:hypothetical protein